ncbi:MAG: hypothetical protein Q8L48_42300 [Archangium sp.]|nr:hypothetical protein [Archangium sp.]
MDAIQYVSSGVTLAAFIAAIVSGIVRRRIDAQKNLIESAQEQDRAPLVDKALEAFTIETSNLTKEQKYTLALEQLYERRRRVREVLIAFVALALLGGGGFVYATGSQIWPVRPDTDPPLSQPFCIKHKPDGRIVFCNHATLAACEAYLHKRPGSPFEQNHECIERKL